MAANGEAAALSLETAHAPSDFFFDFFLSSFLSFLPSLSFPLLLSFLASARM